MGNAKPTRIEPGVYAYRGFYIGRRTHRALSDRYSKWRPYKAAVRWYIYKKLVAGTLLALWDPTDYERLADAQNAIDDVLGKEASA